MKIGIGYDVHKFVKGRPLIVGGIKIPFPKACSAGRTVTS